MKANIVRNASKTDYSRFNSTVSNVCGLTLKMINTGVLISIEPDQEGNGSPGTCNPEETGLPGLPIS
jgi:hypothetical protein